MGRTLRCFLLLTLVAASGESQEVHYSYAHSGTGFFSLGGRSVQVARIPFAYRLREAENEQWGLKLRFPVSLGFHEFTIREGLDQPLKETVETIALAVGLEAEIPRRKSWRLKPYAEIGLGKRLSGNEEALLYRAGMRSVWRVPRERLDLRLGAALKFEGFELLDGDARDSYGVAEVGGEIRWPAGFELRENPANLGAYLIARRFLPEIELVPRGSEPTVIENQTELGLTFGTEPSLSLWGLDAPRLGLAYRWGDGLSAYRLNFGFPF